MNIFVLDKDPEKAAKYHVDRHVVKMPTEAAQMLCSVLEQKTGTPRRFKMVYPNHPCTVWAGRSYPNFEWLYNYGVALCEEYSYRYGRVHGSLLVLDECWADADEVKNWNLDLTPPPKVVSEPYKMFDPVTAYRLYYLFEKDRLFSWKNRPMPYWIRDRSWVKDCGF